MEIKKRYFLLLLFLFLYWNPSNAQYVKSVTNPSINLNGTWYLSINPKKDFWKPNEINTNWKKIQVPGEVMMQGFSIHNDIPFAYKKEISIPLDYKGKHIYLQFDGVYSYAKIWINGSFVREHFGGFTSWKCDITPYVQAGEKAWISLEVTDRSDDISYASGYAKHQIAGILRDVSLLALPHNYPETIQVTTDLDTQYKNANLIVSGELKDKPESTTTIKIQLLDAAKKEIQLKTTTIQLDRKTNFKISNTIVNPKKWDAEHPNLFTLKISYFENKVLLWSTVKYVGFREIKIDGNSFLINGSQVKLRGACRHDIHPTLGRVATPAYDLKDVLLAKEANMNFIRTSHYPPTENFLNLCDKYGIYVEDETAVCFIIDYRIDGYKTAVKSFSDSTYTNRYLSQLKEMVNLHKNHPSIIMWSIGNESIFGTNFQKSFDWIKINDKTRPVLFSYPGTVPDSIANPYDILSFHYPNFNTDRVQYNKQAKNFGYAEMPVLFDEWAHVACYNNATIREDPNVRNYWGRSLNVMWAKTFDAKGGLGGAIWGMIDETFMLPVNLKGYGEWWGIKENSVWPYQGTTIGYGEWGIVDVWRRKKPEFWNTKKAYSPIKLLKTTLKYNIGKPISIPIYNRFDHTNLTEITIKYTYKGKTKTIEAFYLKPHKKGILKLPIQNWDSSEKIKIDFFDKQAKLIDSYKIQQSSYKIKELPIAKTIKKITVIDKDTMFVIHTIKGDFSINKQTGLLNSIGDLKISGPYLNYKTEGNKINYSTFETNNYEQNWKLKKLNFKRKNSSVLIAIEGNYDTISVQFELIITSDGHLKTMYSYTNLPNEFTREIGVRYDIDPIFDAVSWDRIGFWSSYPENHISALSGSVQLYSNSLNKYKEKPKKHWTEDSKSFYYNGTRSESSTALTRIAKATKENCLEYSLLKKDKKWLSVLGQGQLACRLAKNGSVLNLYLNSIVDYTNLNWGNYEQLVKLEGSYFGEVSLVVLPNQ